MLDRINRDVMFNSRSGVNAKQIPAWRHQDRLDFEK